jgi:hypothetical protein
VLADNSMLTDIDYGKMMDQIRKSFAYRALQKLNLPSDEKVTQPVESITVDSRFSSTDNYFLLEKIYSILQDNYYSGEKFDNAQLIY